MDDAREAPSDVGAPARTGPASRRSASPASPDLEALSPLDAALLRMETPELLLHVGTLLILDPPTDPARRSLNAFGELVAARLHRVPRYRQKVVEAPPPLSTPFWVDDPDFDLAYHVRQAALPAPGTIAQLTDYCARILSRPLDRSRPLWELYLIEGLEHGRVAVLSKGHHAMIDVLHGVDLSAVMLDATDEPEATSSSASPWVPRRTPGAAELARAAAENLIASPTQVIAAVRAAAAAPLASARRVAALGSSTVRMVRSRLTRPAPRSLLNRDPGRNRRLAIQRLALDDVKVVKNAFGTTVTDVVLAVVTDMVGRHLRAHGARTDGLWLRALVPVSSQDGVDEHRLRSEVVAVFVDLPMAEMDPVERLQVCREAMGDVRSSHGAVGAGFLLGLDEFAPATLHALAARVAVDARVFNFAITNVPGPQRPTYCNGARLLGAFPFTSLPPGQGLGVGITSIDGWLNVGLTANYDTVPDVESMTTSLVTSLAELVACAGALRPTTVGAPIAPVRGPDPLVASSEA